MGFIDLVAGAILTGKSQKDTSAIFAGMTKLKKNRLIKSLNENRRIVYANRERRPIDHDYWVIRAGARYYANTGIMPTRDKTHNADFVAKDLYFEIDMNTKNYDGDRKLKQQFENYTNGERVIFLCKGRNVSDENHCEKILYFGDKFRKETKKQLSLYVCPLRDYVEGKTQIALSRKKNSQIIKLKI
jgi:hypothetical protein